MGASRRLRSRLADLKRPDFELQDVRFEWPFPKGAAIFILTAAFSSQVA
jgi:hypothetical protein